MSIWSRFILLPYLLCNGLIWHLQRIIFREDCYNEIIPGLFVGRRSFAQELPNNINLIVDLTAEFVEPEGVRDGKNYICVPTLDASVPEEQDFIDLVKTISSYYDRQQNIYIHCALGHGRAAAVAAGFLLSKGLVADVDEALNLLKEKRSVVKLNSAQIQGLERLIYTQESQTP
jgi:protein-tyrosine phosphatase